ncbi:MAG: tRNA pseudouridine(38-40) synthase TruA [Spirochaetales bacterium]|nr:tRNA pseudouridine(38-40) synthase TruA [Spirochaetales bacterium]
MERVIKLIVSYDGTDFAGWQVQDGQRTVQGVIQDALATIHGSPVKVIGAGRTDSGVHAAGQAAHFHTDKNLPPEKFRDALNYYLSRDVSVLKSTEAGPDFHARFSAAARVYQYYLYFGPASIPHFERYSLRWLKRPDLKRINEMAALLVGEKDFTVFAASGDSSRSKVRVVHSASFFPQGVFLVFKIVADAFLYKMVRSIVGTILNLDREGLPVENFRDILESGNRDSAGPTIQAKGLFLEKVIYPDEANNII